jgi:glycosyltransferase involved in cell wall biosynthesis
MKNILMIAFHYPPYHGGSGIHRTLKFSRHLPDYDWQPIVLSAAPRAYPQIDSKQLGNIPKDVRVKRAFALDAARHFSLRGSYLKWTAMPDRWATWLLGAIPIGLRLVRKYRPNVIWSTYPIATAHLIGLVLRRLTGVPWVADFRDSMTEDCYPPDPQTRRVYRWIEQQTVKYCARAVFTTPGTAAIYRDRYPQIPEYRWSIIANGYDEEDFAAVEQMPGKRSNANGCTVLVHSGFLYRSERDPLTFFAALAHLRQSGEISGANLRIIFRGSGSEDFYGQQLRRYGIEDIVTLEKSIPHHAALAEILGADGLLLFQAANCNHQIPAKIYEYLRARRPLMAITDAGGDTAALLRSVGVHAIAPLDQKDQIIKALREFLQKIHNRQTVTASDRDLKSHTRKARTQELVAILESLGVASTG